MSASVRGIGVAVMTSWWGAGPPALAGERGPLEHAEAVLLVDHHEGEAGEGHAFLHEGVGPDQEIELSRGRGRPELGAARPRHRGRQQADPQRCRPALRPPASRRSVRSCCSASSSVGAISAL